MESSILHPDMEKFFWLKICWMPMDEPTSAIDYK